MTDTPEDTEKKIQGIKNYQNLVASVWINAVCRSIALGIVALMVVTWLVNKVAPTDATDFSPDHRSGVKLVTDYGTMCQYLQTDQGTLTPRLDKTGKQMCA